MLMDGIIIKGCTYKRLSERSRGFMKGVDFLTFFWGSLVFESTLNLSQLDTMDMYQRCIHVKVWNSLALGNVFAGG